MTYIFEFNWIKGKYRIESYYSADSRECSLKIYLINLPVPLLVHNSCQFSGGETRRQSVNEIGGNWTHELNEFFFELKNTSKNKDNLIKYYNLIFQHL